MMERRPAGLKGFIEGFIEAFFEWRPLTWFSVEPDLQLYFLGRDTHVVTGLRCKVKL